MRRPRIVIFPLLVGLLVPAGASAVELGAASAPPVSPAISVGAVDCAAGGVWTSLTNAGATPATYTFERDGRALDAVVLDAGTTGARQLVEIPAGGSSLVTVRQQGGGYVSAQVSSDCPAPTRTSASGQLPFTGIGGLGFIAFAGAMMVVAGACLHAVARRQRRAVPEDGSITC